MKSNAFYLPVKLTNTLWTDTVGMASYSREIFSL